ncbi:hypothetical protein FJY94_01495 [Candidatus Kaiserbacteria bacterium]|nr:hypothetical protein [Candidatus Kaiserbacteria bacterium]
METKAPIDGLFSTRLATILERNGFRSIEDFYGKSEMDLLRLEGMGRRGISEIIDVLRGRGVILRFAAPPKSGDS